ncbi:hypothetical protein BKA01_005043 [Pseudonocardia eucalypti]|nr:hypothetical protein [Pseudonocardia eucalypti]
MASDRERLRHIVDALSDDEARELLAVVRQRSGEQAPKRRPSWVGALHEGPDFAKQAKETIRAELSGGQ